MPLQAGNNSAAVYAAVLDIAGSSTSSGVFASIGNPAGVDLLVTRATLRITTQSSGASTLDVGIHASSASTSADNLIDGLSGASTGIFDSFNDTDNGTNGVAKPQVWAAAGYINVAEASGNVDALVGKLYIEYTYA